MSDLQSLRDQVRAELKLAAQAEGPVLTVQSEADIAALVKLIREVGSNPLLAGQLGRVDSVGAMRIRVLHGNYDGCGCRAGADDQATPHEPARSQAAAKPQALSPALAGVITLARIQAAKIPKDSTILLDIDAVLTPQVRDWLRQNKVQVQRSES